jgi:hypothetical protein
LANGSQCIYGVSRKHGKPGRTRKRNPDGSPFIKVSKQRPSPDGSEFGKFRITTESTLHGLPDFSDAASSWSSNWSSTPSLPGTPEFDFELTPEPFYGDMSDLTFMDDILLPTSQLDPEPMQSIEPTLTFRDPFAKRQSVQLNLPDIQALKDFIGGDMVNPMDYSYSDVSLDPYMFTSESSSPQSPKTMSMNNTYNPMRVSISMPTSHCCYTLAYSTLESLRIIGSDATNAYPSMECKSLDNVLTITRLAVQSVLQLLSCSCSSDPHLAMLYSSITSKLLTWYQIAADVNVTARAPLSPASSAEDEEPAFNINFEPLHFGVYQFDAQEQQLLRRQIVLRELKNCGQLVEALANWRGEGEAGQGEFLYDVLGAWLKSELYKTVKEVELAQAV